MLEPNPDKDQQLTIKRDPNLKKILFESTTLLPIIYTVRRVPGLHCMNLHKPLQKYEKKISRVKKICTQQWDTNDPGKTDLIIRYGNKRWCDISSNGNNRKKNSLNTEENLENLQTYPSIRPTRLLVNFQQADIDYMFTIYGNPQIGPRGDILKVPWGEYWPIWFGRRDMKGE